MRGGSTESQHAMISYSLYLPKGQLLPRISVTNVTKHGSPLFSLCSEADRYVVMAHLKATLSSMTVSIEPPRNSCGSIYNDLL